MNTKKKYPLPAYNNESGEFQLTYLNENGDQLFEPLNESKHNTIFGKKKVDELKRVFNNIADPSILPDQPGEELSKADLLSAKKSYLKSILYYEDQRMYDYLSQYSFNSYVIDQHNHANVTILAAPSNRGKTVNQEALFKIMSLPCYGTGADSSAYLRRAVDLGFTPIIDESQSSLSDTKSDDHALLTTGTSRGGRINRVQPVKNGTDFVLQSFNSFGPKVFGARYIPDDEAILNRSFVIRLVKVDESKLSKLIDPLSEEAIRKSQCIRNNMTYYRLKRLNGLSDIPTVEELEQKGFKLNGRTKKLFSPLLLEAPTHECRVSIYSLINDQIANQKEDRENSIEATVLISGFKLLCGSDTIPTCKNISLMSQDWLGIRVAAKTTGKILRQYGIKTRRTQCGWAIDCTVEEYKKKLLDLDINVPNVNFDTNQGGFND